MNIIWVFGDQMRAQAQGHMGDPNAVTPNIDRLAAEGVVFTDAVAGCPLCCPFRGSLLTGQYPHRAIPGHQYPLPDGMPTLAHTFAEAGYRTAYFGKWHLDGWKEHEGRAAFHIVPKERRGGFETWLGYENNNSQWDCWLHGHTESDEVDLYRLPSFETDCLTDLLIDYVRDRGREKATGTSKPFFAALSVQPPHDPYTAPAEYMAKYNPARLEMRPNVPQEVGWVNERARRELAGYYALIENLDWNLGRIRTALAEANLTEETLIVFFSDHGDQHGSQGQFRKTAPWEESIRVPFIIGGGVPFYGMKRGRLPVPINHVDIAPTTLGLCGIAKPEAMSGFDYAGHVLRGKTVEGEPDSAYLQLVVPTGHGDSVNGAWRGLVTRDGWKYVTLEGMPWLLFDLNTDPYERVNLVHNSRFGNRRRQLQERLAAWISDTGDDYPLHTAS
ncbi:MAG: sulfatase [Armatimonadaceae bacterium]